MSEKLLFTKEHEWIRVVGNTATVGITDFAQSELGDIIFVELPEIEEEFNSNDVFGTIEAVKTVADLFMPVSAKILKINNSIEDEPEKINKDAEGVGWIVEIEIQNLEELDSLLTRQEYDQLINN
tara:strand:+ start:109 stop:483 length:375 start_codon:yes stop_codon:yes gene_type:complete